MTAPVVVDWRARSHWSATARPCRICRRPSHLVDDAGAACHKVCAESEAAAVLAARARTHHAALRPARPPHEPKGPTQ